jgi:hypothetical protein
MDFRHVKQTDNQSDNQNSYVPGPTPIQRINNVSRPYTRQRAVQFAKENKKRRLQDPKASSGPGLASFKEQSVEDGEEVSSRPPPPPPRPQTSIMALMARLLTRPPQTAQQQKQQQQAALPRDNSGAQQPGVPLSDYLKSSVSSSSVPPPRSILGQQQQRSQPPQNREPTSTLSVRHAQHLKWLGYAIPNDLEIRPNRYQEYSQHTRFAVPFPAPNASVSLGDVWLAVMKNDASQTDAILLHDVKVNIRNKVNLHCKRLVNSEYLEDSLKKCDYIAILFNHKAAMGTQQVGHSTFDIHAFMTLNMFPSIEQFSIEKLGKNPQLLVKAAKQAETREQRGLRPHTVQGVAYVDVICSGLHGAGILLTELETGRMQKLFQDQDENYVVYNTVALQGITTAYSYYVFRGYRRTLDMQTIYPPFEGYGFDSDSDFKKLFKSGQNLAPLKVIKNENIDSNGAMLMKEVVLQQNRAGGGGGGSTARAPRPRRRPRPCPCGPRRQERG